MSGLTPLPIYPALSVYESKERTVQRGQGHWILPAASLLFRISTKVWSLQMFICGLLIQIIVISGSMRVPSPIWCTKGKREYTGLALVSNLHHFQEHFILNSLGKHGVLKSSSTCNRDRQSLKAEAETINLGKPLRVSLKQRSPILWRCFYHGDIYDQSPPPGITDAFMKRHLGMISIIVFFNLLAPWKVPSKLHTIAGDLLRCVIALQYCKLQIDGAATSSQYACSSWTAPAFFACPQSAIVSAAHYAAGHCRQSICFQKPRSLGLLWFLPPQKPTSAIKKVESKSILTHLFACIGVLSHSPTQGHKSSPSYALCHMSKVREGQT